MNTSTRSFARITRTLVATILISMAVASCATTAPIYPAGSAEVRSKLDRLQSDPNLADQAPVEIREAEAAVLIAEQPIGKDDALGKHRVYMADRKVEIAIAKASTGYAQDQRAGLSQARDEARLAARTHEADKARQETAKAQKETDAARTKALLAEADAESNAKAARAKAALAEADAVRNARKLQQQIDVLQAEATDRGLVLTLGNTLFATGKSDLKPASTTSLDKLVVFLNDYPNRNVTVEGHTDDVGSDQLNQTLSQHRADSVKTYLVAQGIQNQRITASGIGETKPIADNLSASGRQQNRRVEVIIDNPPSSVPAAPKI
jgi:outer membrane protein OmpA-like peptidoglycan-associated protein